MKTVNMHEAKTHLSRLVEAASRGEPFVIARAGKPLVKVVPLVEEAEAEPDPDAPVKRRLGFLRGQFKVPDDFDTMYAEEIRAMFEDGPLFRPSAMPEGRILFDTQLLIWMSDRFERLPARAEALATDLGVTVVFSAATIWEMAIKFALRRPGFTFEPVRFQSALLAEGYQELPVTGAHGAAVANLPRLHGDPFDRLMIAQARAEGLPFVTADRPLAAYGAPVEVV